VHPRLQPLEARPDVLVEGDDLAIQQWPMARQTGVGAGGRQILVRVMAKLRGRKPAPRRA
jgi:hypothetical protein